MFHGDSIHKPTMTNQTNVTGMKIFHPKRMIWSYLYLGKLARTHKNMVTTTNVLRPNQIHPGTQLKSKLSKGDNHPPKNMMTDNMETKIMFAYSAKKNMAKDMPEYSIM